MRDEDEDACIVVVSHSLMDSLIVSVRILGPSTMYAFAMRHHREAVFHIVALKDMCLHIVLFKSTSRVSRFCNFALRTMMKRRNSALRVNTMLRLLILRRFLNHTARDRLITCDVCEVKDGQGLQCD